MKKLLLIFWEVWPKTTPDGKLLQEMILVCDAYRKVSYSLLYSLCYFLSTEFVCGRMLKFRLSEYKEHLAISQFPDNKLN